MNRTWLASVLMFVWLTVGYAAVHAVLGAWIFSLWTVTFRNAVPNEHLVMTEDGEALIASYAPKLPMTYRHLDGTPVPPVTESNLKLNIAVYQYNGDRPQSDSEPWFFRVTPFQDSQTPTMFWYHVTPPNRQRTSYFEGYDQTSLRRVGYLGLKGFSSQRPGIEESFELQNPGGRWAYGAITAVQEFRYRAMEPQNDSQSAYEVVNATPDMVWILSRNAIYEIRLGSRTVRPVLQNQPDLRNLSHAVIHRDGKNYLQLLARTASGLLILDPATTQSEFVKLDPLGPREYERFFQTHDGQRIVVRLEYPNMWAQPRKTDEISWLDAEGHVARTATATTQNTNNNDPGLFLPLCCPTPVIAFGMWLTCPWFGSNRMALKETYWEQYVQFASLLWDFLCITLAVGIATGWACWRREREVFEDTGWFWPIVVGLCGWFGWMGYICLRPLPARLPNRQWMRAQPEPNQALGTEIFA